MKSNSLKSLAVFFTAAVIFTSCLKSNENEVTYSNNATFLSLTLAKNDTVKSAVFTLKASLNGEDSIIENVDSLVYGTKVDSVYPTFKFRSSAAAFVFYNGSTKDSIYLDGTDTLDFTKEKVMIRNYASDRISHVDYQVKVNVHKVDPELYVWSKVESSPKATPSSSQKAVLLNTKFYYFLNNGSETNMYTSNDGYEWSDASVVTGLPLDVKLENLQVYNNKMYLTLGGTKIYTSTTGSSWIAVDYTAENYSFESLLFALNGSLWAITKSEIDSKYRFASSVDGSTWLIKGELPSDFPVSDFTALSFETRIGKAKAIVIGGKNAAGTSLNTNWNTENGTYWIDFSAVNNTLDTLAIGATVINYDNKLLMLGQSNYFNKLMMESIDEGLSWKKPDVKKNVLPTEYGVRNYQSALVDASNRIFVIGGMNNATFFSDVWTSKLNRKSFKIQ